MPWSPADCTIKDLTDEQKSKWASVANGIFKDLKKKGFDHARAETKAIQIANLRFSSVVRFNPVLPSHVNFNLNFNGNEHHGIDMPAEDEPDEDEDTLDDKVDPNKSSEKEMKEIDEMEIFRCGTHNGDAFSEADLEEMAANFLALKEEVRPKLKITHAEDSSQESLAGLASYGDVMDIFVKKGADGIKRLFAKLARVPLEVYNWIKEGRFAERSIELYPEFKLGTKEDAPVYKNVLKAIALLGHQMPAVTGMTPILLEECLECQNTACFRETVKELDKTLELNLDHSQAFLMFDKTIELELKELQHSLQNAKGR